MAKPRYMDRDEVFTLLVINLLNMPCDKPGETCFNYLSEKRLCAPNLNVRAGCPYWIQDRITKLFIFTSEEECARRPVGKAFEALKERYPTSRFAFGPEIPADYTTWPGHHLFDEAWNNIFKAVEDFRRFIHSCGNMDEWIFFNYYSERCFNHLKFLPTSFHPDMERGHVLFIPHLLEPDTLDNFDVTQQECWSFQVWLELNLVYTPSVSGMLPLLSKIKKCPVCQKYFWPAYKTAVTCSQKCRTRYNYYRGREDEMPLRKED